MSIVDTLKTITENEASDVFIIAGLPLTYKSHGQMFKVSTDKLMPADTDEFITEIYALAQNRNMERLRKCGDDDFSFALKGVARFRINAFKQRGSLSAVIRIITFSIPDPKSRNIPDDIISFADKKKGLVLITGPAGSGKSTTLA